jgi:5-enolpyruvylshikimate-3-phosphate synthase
LPTEVPKGIDIDVVMKYMESDKKKKNDEIYIVVLEELGKAVTKTIPIDRKIIKRIISPTLKIKKALPTSSDVKIIKLPGSKSITNRVLLMCALGNGITKLSNVLDAEDTRIMLKALTDLKACEILERSGDSLIIKGNAGKLVPPENPLYVGTIKETS